MDIEKAIRRGIEKEDEERYGITAEEREDYIDDRSEYRNEYSKADALGHAAGDSALKKVAEILKYSVREADVVARLHGDEFAIFLPRANEENARTVAEKILKNLESDAELQQFGISASIGARHVDKSGLTELMTPETLIKDADLQQANVKQTGKGRIEMHREP